MIYHLINNIFQSSLQAELSLYDKKEEANDKKTKISPRTKYQWLAQPVGPVLVSECVAL